MPYRWVAVASRANHLRVPLQSQVACSREVQVTPAVDERVRSRRALHDMDRLRIHARTSIEAERDSQAEGDSPRLPFQHTSISRGAKALPAPAIGLHAPREKNWMPDLEELATWQGT